MKIGITLPPKEIAGRKRKYKNYFKWLEKGGVQPVALYTDEGINLDDLRGILFSGGGDVDPALYGEENRYSRGVIRSRDEMEIFLINEALKRGIPVLAICRGLQIVNVALGGSLYQDLPKELGLFSHRGEEDDAVHRVVLENEPNLLSPIGEKNMEVNSSHHQAIKKVGKGLRIIARSEDGVIEALEYPGHPFFLAVQWHPERWEGESSRIILETFLGAC
jgi:putative glutamine amidotransferase